MSIDWPGWRDDLRRAVQIAALAAELLTEGIESAIKMNSQQKHG